MAARGRNRRNGSRLLSSLAAAIGGKVSCGAAEGAWGNGRVKDDFFNRPPGSCRYTARSTTFRNSRTLPGWDRLKLGQRSRREPRPVDQSSPTAMRRPKCSTSSGTSSCRARSGGSVITSNDRRSRRSARNFPCRLASGDPVGRRDDAHVDRDGPDAPMRDLAIFDSAQEPVPSAWTRSRARPEKRSAVGFLEAAVTSLGRR